MISRTYVVRASNSVSHANGIKLEEFVFDDQAAGRVVYGCGVVREEVAANEWRVGYYDDEKSWASKRPKPGKTNGLTRRHEA